ncbi:hypothetical protein EHO59_12835 [Leptospira semungkisensis]|uniref:Uncharacterized protein n=1 Tax=Leptospira semungkisensis TaxID=2484985 RepID=A0A4R9FPX0_9LEPT|nr:hypothetical protein [Leptospira semungkisensis]TGK00812.1 hypothetical protein EHO59_12835 [Leptospira semungkisensis]
MKQSNPILIALVLVLLGATLYLGNLILTISQIKDTIEYVSKESNTSLVSGEKLSYLILKRSKGIFGGYFYYFGAKKGKDVLPFMQIYAPILDSDRDKFDKIEGLEECGTDSYVLILSVNNTLKYLHFTPFDAKVNEVDEKKVKACRRGR